MTAIPINTDGVFLGLVHFDRLMVALKLASSRSEAQRLIEQRAVKIYAKDIEPEVVDSPAFLVPLNESFAIKVGKIRWAKAVIPAIVPTLTVEDVPEGENEQ